MPRLARGIGLAVAAAFVLSGCGEDAGAATPTTTQVPLGTVALDGLPEALSTGTLPVPPTLAPDPANTEPPPTSEPLLDLEPGSRPISPSEVGRYVTGNRLLMLGDSILASTAPTFGGPMCSALNQFGWTTEIVAATGRHVEYGEEVLDFREAAGDADFDVAAVMLGNNYRGDYDAFTAAYDRLLDRLAPRPTLVYTLTEKHPDHSRINDWLRWRSYFHPNVVVVEWAAPTAAEPERLLAGDRLHLSDEGRGRLAMFTAAALGEAPPALGIPTCADTVS